MTVDDFVDEDELVVLEVVVVDDELVVFEVVVVEDSVTSEEVTGSALLPETLNSSFTV